MRRLALGLLALTVPAAAHAQPSDLLPEQPSDSLLVRESIRSWMGVGGALMTDFGSIAPAVDYRFTIGRLGGPNVGVMLGTIARAGDQIGARIGNGRGSFSFGALFGGRSLELNDAAFVNASIGVGYGQGMTKTCTRIQDYPYCESKRIRGLIVPARVEVHVARSSRASFGASVSAVLTSPTKSLIGVGLHTNFGRNLRGGE